MKPSVEFVRDELVHKAVVPPHLYSRPSNM
jgi:hypothetical protein